MFFLEGTIILLAISTTYCQVTLQLERVDRFTLGAIQLGFIALAVYAPWRYIVGDQVSGVYFPALGTAIVVAAGITFLSIILGEWFNSLDDE